MGRLLFRYLSVEIVRRDAALKTLCIMRLKPKFCAGLHGTIG
jgi:hypothetical protein